MKSPIQFALQREDPRLEEMLLDRMGPGKKRFFGVTAAGDTLLSLAARPDLEELIGADFDPRQTAWARFKLSAAKQLSRKDFCRVLGISQVDAGTREALIGKVLQGLPPEDRAFLKAEKAFFANGAFDDGTFERLFAAWRAFFERFVVSREEIQRLFEGDAAVIDAILRSELWPVSFELFFHQSVLATLFGPDAIQHAPPGSYPRYFRARFESALRQPGAKANPYLSQVLRGRYGALDGGEAVPDYLLPQRFDRLAEGVGRVRCETGRVQEILARHPGPYQIVQLSNILDWSSEADSEAMAEPVLQAIAPGGYLLVRQLNNVRPLPMLWTRALDFDPALERELHAADRSFFYSAVRVGRKR